VKRVFSTADVDPRDRCAYWHDVVCTNIADRDFSPESGQTFQAELHLGAITNIRLALCVTSPMSMVHAARHVGRTNTDELLVCRLMAGTLVEEQDGRETVLNAGDIVLNDPRRPYAGKLLQNSKLLILKVPRHLLEDRIGDTGVMTARTIKRAQKEHRLTSALLGMLPAYSTNPESPALDIVRDHALDLVAVSLAAATDGGKARVSSARSFALIAVRTTIESRLSDPDLDPESVAAAAGVTLRFANQVLAHEGTSIARLIQSRRLERCRRALEDPMQVRRTVSEVAYGWGFSDLTHFGRRFKAAYGHTPSEYRRNVKTS
jgi:AraC family transcriptional activator of tynA and feaB